MPSSPQHSPTENASEDLSSWDLFVLRHRKRGNLVVHFFSFLTYYGSLFGLIITWHPAWVLGLFLSGMIGAAGHYIYDDGRVKIKEATFDPMVVFYVTIMFYKIFRRRYAEDVAAAEQRLQLWRESEAQLEGLETKTI